jgi:hypothetical protein
LIKALYIFNVSGVLLFHHDVGEEKGDSMLVGSFLAAINQWSRMYSDSGVALFLTGNIRLVFDRSIYAPELVFCVVASKTHDDADLADAAQTFREQFVHFFWEDRTALEEGVITTEKMDQFKEFIASNIDALAKT